jgi:hypothetical protein
MRYSKEIQNRNPAGAARSAGDGVLTRASAGAGEPEPWTTEKHKRVALDVARESVVLLKNANGFLPLDKNAIKSIAVVGPRAGEVLIDLYGGRPPYAITPVQGIRAKVAPGTAVNYAADNKRWRGGEGGPFVGCGGGRGGESSHVQRGQHHGDFQYGRFEQTLRRSRRRPRGARPGVHRPVAGNELIKQVYAANPKTVGGAGVELSVRDQLDPTERAGHSAHRARRAGARHGGRRCIVRRLTIRRGV